MQEILNKLNRYEIEIRKAVNSQTHGNFKSIFRGAGLEFADLRSYQYGDDIRSIDWKATAKGHDTYVKVFKEDKEQTVFFLLDVSASQEVGTQTKQKIDTAKEIAAVLALSAIREQSHVGLFCFTDQKELYIKPEKRQLNDYGLIADLYSLVPKSNKTALSWAIRFTLNILKRRSLIILISDFLDKDFSNHLKALARKHDLVVVHLYDDREVNLPKMGIVPVFNKETNTKYWINSSSNAFRKLLKSTFDESKAAIYKLVRENNASYIDIESKEHYVPRLIQLFKKRNKK